MNNLSGEAAGAPASASPEPSATPEQSQETKPLTIADVERIAEEKATRIAQSMVDKAESRISRKAQEQIAAIDLSRQALGLNDEQVKAAKQQVIYNDLTAQPAAEQASPAPQAQANQQASEFDQVVSETLAVFDSEGIGIEEADPEYKPLDTLLRAPKFNIHAYRKELYKQVEAKKARTAANQEQAPARVVSGGQSQTPSEPNVTAGSYFRNAHKK